MTHPTTRFCEARAVRPALLGIAPHVHRCTITADAQHGDGEHRCGACGDMFAAGPIDLYAVLGERVTALEAFRVAAERWLSEITDSTNTAIAAVMRRVEDVATPQITEPAKPAESVSNEIKSRWLPQVPPSGDLGSAKRTAAGAEQFRPTPGLTRDGTPLEVFGLPVAVDDALPEGLIEFRDSMTGAVLARIDTRIYTSVNLTVPPSDWRVQ